MTYAPVLVWGGVAVVVAIWATIKTLLHPEAYRKALAETHVPVEARWTVVLLIAACWPLFPVVYIADKRGWL